MRDVPVLRRISLCTRLLLQTRYCSTPNIMRSILYSRMITYSRGIMFAGALTITTHQITARQMPHQAWPSMANNWL